MRTRREIETRVKELLDKHAIANSPVDVQKIATEEGLAVLGQDFSGDVSGALVRYGGGAAAIAFNERQSTSRIRFTIAHELAHYLLGHTDDEDHVDWEFSIIRRDSNSSRASDVREIEANMFAANLLMPRSFIDKDVSLFIDPGRKVKLTDERISVLASKYRVSNAAMTFRLINLGYLPPY
ncbi:ImmA/IrrE family metallo-endopeptidase [Granulicella paludicola]|uniref:ImmA/IrrE family metallo-endopeptidase n=1 Tax=Granulicella paludicola TaxID=474951 RepID=UPI0021E0DED1|nr:ImmA/IrrE family metallo-endopeptidase [Granulicella paludicola]